MKKHSGYFDDEEDAAYESDNESTSTASSSDENEAEANDVNDDDDADEIEPDEDEDMEDPDEYDEDDVVAKKQITSLLKFGGAGTGATLTAAAMDSDDSDSDSDSDEEYLQKFNKELNHNYLLTSHPESVMHNYDEILAMTKVVKNEDGIIVDPLHKTMPYLTKYEKARVIGQRSKQLNAGAFPFVKVPETIIDGYLIAEMELKAKRIPFIIRRPLPNGGSEYWKLQDLEDISF